MPTLNRIGCLSTPPAPKQFTLSAPEPTKNCLRTIDADAGISLDSKARPGAPGQFQYAGGMGIMSPYYPTPPLLIKFTLSAPEPTKNSSRAIDAERRHFLGFEGETWGTRPIPVRGGNRYHVPLLPRTRKQDRSKSSDRRKLSAAF